MRLRSFFAASACAVAVAAVGAGSAFAGEITGPSTPTGGDQTNPTAAPDNANSICAFSGQNHVHAGEPPSRVRSYGQLVAAGLKADFPSPGDACNGNLNPLK
jgi:hypothetical protein